MILAFVQIALSPLLGAARAKPTLIVVGSAGVGVVAVVGGGGAAGASKAMALDSKELVTGGGGATIKSAHVRKLLDTPALPSQYVLCCAVLCCVCAVFAASLLTL